MTRRVSLLPFEEIEHTADFAIRARGVTLGALFANAARGMYAIAGAKARTSDPAARQIELTAMDVETLLVDWLTELVYLMEQEGLVFNEYDVQATPTTLRAAVAGGPMIEARRRIKAVTYHNLEVVQTANGYETTVVFDV